MDKKKDYVKFETEIFYNENEFYTTKKTLLCKGKLSEHFLDELWEKDSLDDKLLKQPQNRGIKMTAGNLWKTSGGRIVLDNHTCEAFAEPYDKILMTKKELTQGIKVSKFLERLIK